MTDLGIMVDVFEAVEKGRTTYGIVPYENSTFGSVVETLDYLIKANVKVRSETYLTVSKKEEGKRIKSSPLSTVIIRSINAYFPTALSIRSTKCTAILR